jgi:signal transduction histidine kinase/ActR/RegA family two-component response regulator
VSISFDIQHAILRDLPCGVWVARAPGGEFVYANEAFNEIMGMGPVADAKVGGYTGPYGIFGRDGTPFPEEALPFVRALKERTTVIVDDIVIHRRDGSRVNVRAFGKPLLGPSGDVELVMVSFFDITAQVLAELDGETARTRLALAVQHAPLLIWATDAKGVITLSEGAASKAIGIPPGHNVGKSVEALYGSNPAILRDMRRALSGESFSTPPTEIGSAVLETWMGPLRDRGGAITGIIGVSTDVTERFRATQRAARTDRMVAMGTMAASVAHEINNPLTYVLEGLRSIEREVRALGAELLPRADEETRKRFERLTRLLPEVKEGAERVRVITGDLQTFSRPDAGGKDSTADLKRAAEAAVQMLKNQLEARATLKLLLAEGAIVRGSEPRIVQIFVNLLLNAVQALGDRPRDAAQIGLSVRVDGHSVVAEVSDTGPGFPDGMRERVFEPFVTTKPIGEGTGLGLFVCRNLVTDLGGTIEAENRSQGGALIRVRLPHAPAAAQVPASDTAAASTRARVLLIDDNVSLGRVMADALAADQHHAEVLQSGREAIERLAAGAEYDLVLCDLMMRDMSGMDVYEELRKRRPGAEGTLVFMTGGAFTDAARHFLASVPNSWIQKPFDVCEQVSRLLSQRR